MPAAASDFSHNLRRAAGLAVGGAAVALALSACSPTPANLGHGPLGISQATRAAQAVIYIENTGYSPVISRVPAGGNVLVINSSNENHTLTALNGAFTTPVLSGGNDDASFIVRKPGVYRFYDELNPDSLQGELVVTPAP